jgi:hypothetical protein
MNKLILTTSGLRLFILTLPSCKKYEDGPLISIHSKTKRVSNEWRLEEKFLNGVEQPLDDDDYRFRITFKEDGTCYKTTTNGSSSTSRVGTWNFVNDKEVIRTYFVYTYFATTVTEETFYTILRLKEKELWVRETRSNGDVYEFRFVLA